MKDFFNPRLKKTIRPKRKKAELLFYNPGQKRRNIFKVGTVLFFIGLGYLIYLYAPLAKELVAYQWAKVFLKERLARRAELVIPAPEEAPPMPTPTLPPNPDPGFSIVIPKINAQAKVVPGVNAANKEEYQQALKAGVAHASGTGFPGEGKTIYIFSHSTNAQWNVVRYNAIFFLLNNLEVGDEIWVIYNRRLYPYLVSEKKITEAEDIHYLTDYQDGETLILQTCWPPGTILKRLLVLAKLKGGEIDTER